MGIYQRIKENGIKVSDRYAGTEGYFYLTPQGLTLIRALKPLFFQYATGKLLDAGAGRMAYRYLLEKHCQKYVGLDINKRKELDIVGDILQIRLEDNSFDTVFCSQVLEHVSEPRVAISELYRVLKKKGHLILSVPHLSYLHNEPHDYYRYTKHGLRFMLERVGFKIVVLEPAGGVLSFLGHIPSTIFINWLYNIPILHPVSMLINRVYVRIVCWLDDRLEKQKLYALNYVVVAEK